jgi:transcriptional regulator with XRE-family HTH domain
MNKTEIVNYILLNSKKSIKDISAYLEIARSNIYLWKNGRTIPRIDNINKLAEFTGQPILWKNDNEIQLIKPKVKEKRIAPDKKERMAFLKKTISAQEETITYQKEIIQYQKAELEKYKSGIGDPPYQKEFDEMVTQ